MRRIAQAQTMMIHAQQEEREGQRELAELEVAERVLSGLPSTDEELAALTSPLSALRTVMRRAIAVDPADAMVHSPAHEESASARHQKQAVLQHCYRMLIDGSSKSTEELYAGLTEMGLTLRVVNPVQRLSQILGGEDMFKTVRGLGWMLNASRTASSTVARRSGSVPAEALRNAGLADDDLRRRDRMLVDDVLGHARHGSRERPKTE